MREKVTRIVNDQISGGWADLHAYSSLIAPFLTSIQFHHYIIIIVGRKGIVIHGPLAPLIFVFCERCSKIRNMQLHINLYYFGACLVGREPGRTPGALASHTYDMNLLNGNEC